MIINNYTLLLICAIIFTGIYFANKYIKDDVVKYAINVICMLVLVLIPLVLYYYYYYYNVIKIPIDNNTITGYAYMTIKLKYFFIGLILSLSVIFYVILIFFIYFLVLLIPKLNEKDVNKETVLSLLCVNVIIFVLLSLLILYLDRNTNLKVKMKFPLYSTKSNFVFESFRYYMTKIFNRINKNIEIEDIFEIMYKDGASMWSGDYNESKIRFE